MNAIPAQVPLPVLVGLGLMLGLFALTLLLLIFNYGQLWFQAFWSKAPVTFLELLGMSLRKVNARTIVQAKIMATQAGIGRDISARRLEAHYLAGGDVPRVIRALIAAHRADLDLDFDRACAIDLAGRDVLDAVQTSVNPKVIDCPDSASGIATALSIGSGPIRLVTFADQLRPDAVQALELCGAAEALGHHWGTFRLTNEAVEQPALDLAAALAGHGVPPERFKALRPGEVRMLE